MSHDFDDDDDGFDHAAYLQAMADFSKHEAQYKDQIATALLAFNRVESTIADMISLLLNSRGRPEMVEKVLFDRTFSQQLETLDLLLSSMPRAPRLPISRLKSVGRRRNEFAHNFFEADRNTGQPTLKSRARTETWNPAKVEPFVQDCQAVWKELDALWPWVAFGDTPAELPPGASATPI